jgi:hypothetical protein
LKLFLLFLVALQQQIAGMRGENAEKRDNKTMCQ